LVIDDFWMGDGSGKMGDGRWEMEDGSGDPEAGRKMEV